MLIGNIVYILTIIVKFNASFQYIYIYFSEFHLSLILHLQRSLILLYTKIYLVKNCIFFIL